MRVNGLIGTCPKLIDQIRKAESHPIPCDLQLELQLDRQVGSHSSLASPLTFRYSGVRDPSRGSPRQDTESSSDDWLLTCTR